MTTSIYKRAYRRGRLALEDAALMRLNEACREKTSQEVWDRIRQLQLRIESAMVLIRFLVKLNSKDGKCPRWASEPDKGFKRSAQ